ncbi:MAG TPA: hypothetical protein VFM05_00275, partial [Candidatus Saccharimonadales bacterium]|nr:hypothetical protein [Candidatus Saccharimonadales bacterium]
MLVHSTVLPVKDSLSYTGNSFRTERVIVRNCSTNKVIVAYLDVPIRREPCGVAIIAPAYGETKENNLLISSYFAANGYYGLRFDWTDHVGESQGDIFISTLSKMSTDLDALLDFV